MSAPMPVFFTVDVEMWPPSWQAGAREMNDAFQRYIYGVGRPREYGLPFQLRVLADHGLKAVFFVEPLFSDVLGHEALQEVVGLIHEYDQDVQLHLHPEWRGRAANGALKGKPLVQLRRAGEKEQFALIRQGLDWLTACGVHPVAFRAGGFGANEATLRAVAQVGLRIDASHAPGSARGPISPDFPPDRFSLKLSDNPTLTEVPLTAYQTPLGRMRSLQIGGSSLTEIQGTIRATHQIGYRSVSILSHSAELLDGNRQKADRRAIKRFQGLCRFLGRCPDIRTMHFQEDNNILEGCDWGVAGPPVVRSTWSAAITRLVGQGERRLREWIAL